jgi:putative transposase
MLAQAVRPSLGVATACQAVAVSRATWYRRQRPAHQGAASQAPPGTAAVAAKTPSAAPLALQPAERQAVLDYLQCERFMDQSPRQVWACLLDEGVYLCSLSTMYRLLRQEDAVRERRRQRRHPVYKAPELLATAPNQVWSWDITKLKGPVKWSYYYLYVIMDIFSRYVVGWMVAEAESQALARQLIKQACRQQHIAPGQLTVHADRGAAMKSHSVAELLADLGVVKTHSRPHVSNDNPFSEAQFKTLKYAPDFPARFGSAPDARTFSRTFFTWYNHDHHHSGLALLTPHMVHYGLAEQVLSARQEVLHQAYLRRPGRFHRSPQVPAPPKEVWINPPTRRVGTADEGG